MKSTSQKENSSPPLTADPSLIEILMELHPYLAEDRVIPIALEATQKKNGFLQHLFTQTGRRIIRETAIRNAKTLTGFI